MQQFLKKTTFFSLVGLAAALSACHDETAASSGAAGRYNPTQSTSPATVSQTSRAIESITCALGCCSKKKAGITNNQ
jgi:hypothetical protein